MPLHVSNTFAHRQEGKILLYSLWYHYTYRWPSGAQFERGLWCIKLVNIKINISGTCLLNQPVINPLNTELNPICQ